MRNQHLLFLHTFHAPYIRARLNALQKLLPHGTQMTAVQIAGTDAPRMDWGVPPQLSCDQITLFPDAFLLDIPKRAQVRAVIRLLRAQRPSVLVVAGMRQIVAQAATGWAQATHTPALLHLISTPGSGSRPIRALLKRSLARTYAGIVVPGGRSIDAAVALTKNRAPVFVVPHAVDNAHFAVSTPHALEEQPHFLTVARLAPEKNLSTLMESYALYRRQGGTWGLRIIGDGPCKSDLTSQASALQGVHFQGSVGYDALPRFYGHASCFILPSTREPWGLVVNEALASGLPVLVSMACGCAPELCHPGANGYTFNPTRPTELAALMSHISSAPSLDAYRSQSRAVIASYTPHHWADAFRRALASLGLLSGTAQ